MSNTPHERDFTGFVVEDDLYFMNLRFYDKFVVFKFVLLCLSKPSFCFYIVNWNMKYAKLIFLLIISCWLLIIATYYDCLHRCRAKRQNSPAFDFLLLFQTLRVINSASNALEKSLLLSDSCASPMNNAITSMRNAIIRGWRTKSQNLTTPKFKQQETLWKIHAIFLLTLKPLVLFLDLIFLNIYWIFQICLPIIFEWSPNTFIKYIHEQSHSDKQVTKIRWAAIRIHG